MTKSADAFRTISEVADDLDLPQHVLRFWETRFPQIKPLKRAGGRRFYRPGDVLLLARIRQLLYGEGYTIKGVQKLLKEQGIRSPRAARDPSVDSEGDGDLEDVSLAVPPVGLVLASEGIQPTPIVEPVPRATPDDQDTHRAVLDLIVECETILNRARSSPT